MVENFNSRHSKHEPNKAGPVATYVAAVALGIEVLLPTANAAIIDTSVTRIVYILSKPPASPVPKPALNNLTAALVEQPADPFYTTWLFAPDGEILTEGIAGRYGDTGVSLFIADDLNLSMLRLITNTDITNRTLHTEDGHAGDKIGKIVWTNEVSLPTLMGGYVALINDTGKLIGVEWSDMPISLDVNTRPSIDGDGDGDGANPVPIPGSIGLLGLGLALLERVRAALRRKEKREKSTASTG